MNESQKMTRPEFSRRKLLKSAAAIGSGLLLAEIGLLCPEAAGAAKALDVAAAPAGGKTERVRDILDILATNEAFGVTLIGTVLDSAKNGAYNPPIPDKVVAVLTGVRAQEQFHLDFFKSAGGNLRTDTFYLADPNLLRNPHALFTDLVELEDAAIAAVIASVWSLTKERRIDLLKANFQFATEEAEHRLLANHALGTQPANDHAFAPALYASVAEFYDALKMKGIIGGGSGGKKIVYPGAGAINSNNVIYTAPGGPAVSCTPS